MTIDERIEALVKASEENRKTSEEQRRSIEANRKASEEQRIAIDGLVESTKRLDATAAKQSETMDRIQKGLDTVLEGFREFREDRWHINQSLRTLIENVDRLSAKVDRLTENVTKLENLFTRSLTKPPNGQTD